MTEQRSYLARYLRIISLQMMEAGAEICSELDPLLKPTWLSIISQLDRVPRITVMDAARDMNVSHVHVQNILKSMKTAGVVSASDDPNDGRRTFYTLTSTGRDLLPKVERLREAMQQAVDEVEQETGADLYGSLLSFKGALEEKDWKSRVSGKMQSTRGMDA